MIAQIDFALRDPLRLLGMVVGLQIAVWTLAPALVNSAPPLDVVEGYMLGREWVLATYKHPALPSWVLEASRIATGGAIGWPAYLASQLFVAATFAFVYLLGRDVMDAPRAAAGTLLLTGISAYGWLTPEFNHNVAQLPFWAGIALALWRAVERRSILWWALAGAFAGVGLYAKLTTVLLLATAAAWMVWDEKARRAFATPGPWIGLAVACALASPPAVDGRASLCTAVLCGRARPARH
jgi:4-amino-4-deoxy-L-arabinose transferase-like glycosyltransferase